MPEKYSHVGTWSSGNRIPDPRGLAGIAFRKTGSHGTRTPRVFFLRFSNQYANEEENCCFWNATLSSVVRNVTDLVVLIGSKGARERKANRVWTFIDNKSSGVVIYGTFVSRGTIDGTNRVYYGGKSKGIGTWRNIPGLKNVCGRFGNASNDLFRVRFLSKWFVSRKCFGRIDSMDSRVMLLTRMFFVLKFRVKRCGPCCRCITRGKYICCFFVKSVKQLSLSFWDNSPTVHSLDLQDGFLFSS